MSIRHDPGAADGLVRENAGGDLRYIEDALFAFLGEQRLQGLTCLVCDLSGPARSRLSECLP